MTKPSNLSSIEAATGKPWVEWVQWLNEAGAADLAHPEIAELIHGALKGKIDSPGWWAQNVTVAYEQHIGRRKPGQRNDGTYELSVTKTLAGTREDVFALWKEAYGLIKEFNGRAISDVRTSITPLRSYLRYDLIDGTAITVAVEKKAPARAMISVTHTKLRSSQEKDEWRVYWKDTLERL